MSERAYLFNDAKVTENPNNTDLVGKYLPQVPQHRGSIQFAYTDRRYVNLALGLQMAGKQYDDDLNARGVPANGCAVQSQSCAPRVQTGRQYPGSLGGVAFAQQSHVRLMCADGILRRR